MKELHFKRSVDQNFDILTNKLLIGLQKPLLDSQFLILKFQKHLDNLRFQMPHLALDGIFNTLSFRKDIEQYVCTVCPITMALFSTKD